MHEIVWLCVILLLVGNATSKTLQKTSQIKESFHDSIVMKRDAASFCADKATGDYASPDSCSKYITCSSGIDVERTCPHNLLYDVIHHACDHEYNFLTCPDRCPIPVKQPCETSLPQNTVKKACKRWRAVDLQRARAWYKLTEEGKERKILFPFTFIPWLNQSIESVVFHTAIDPFESRWASLFSTVRSAVGKVKLGIIEQMSTKEFFTYDDYKQVYYSFNNGVKALKTPQYYGNPAFDNAKNIIDSEQWTSDDFFVMKRLAGACPFLLKRVTTDRSVGFHRDLLKKQLNPSFPFDRALSIAIGYSVTIDSAVSTNRLYVLYHEEHNGLASLNDMLDVNPTDTRDMMNTTSPIALFVKDNTGALKIAAIQIDYLPDSKVYTPHSSSVEWLTAKAMVESADGNICQAMHHLSHIHFSSTVYCTIFRRHFSRQHPIYDIMKYHCEGMTPHISLSFPVLSFPEQAGHMLLSVGHTGFVKLATDAYNQHSYDLLDYDKLLSSRGIDDESIKYYPFRDDAKLIWEELEIFATDFVNLYYASDSVVSGDTELQSFANEMSISGRNGKDGGNGKMKGFPAQFTSISQLRTFIQRFIWMVVFHTVVNYPAEPFNSYAPLAPTKMYHDTHADAQTNFARVLPDAPTTIGIAEFATFLGNTRINRIMDHYDKVGHDSLSLIIRKSYTRLHSCIQGILKKRNNERVANNQLPYRYLEPDWIPNSAHI